MNILNTAACSTFSNNNLHNWCMNSTYAPYVVLIGTVLAGCVLAKVCSSANRTLPSQHGSSHPSLAGRVARREALPDSAASVATTAAKTSPSHMEAKPPPRVETSKVHSATAKTEKTILAEKVIQCLEDAGKSIELKKLPPYSNLDELLSLDYLKGFQELFRNYLCNYSKPGELIDPGGILESHLNSFSAALELLVDFYLGKDDFETALQYGLLAIQNGSILFKLVNPLIESNSLEKAEETLEKMRVDEGRAELATKLGLKYLALVPPQMENAKKLLGKLNGSKAVDLATSIVEKHIESKELQEALEILINPSVSLSLGDRKKTCLKAILDEHIKANQLGEALEILENHSFAWCLGDDKKTYLKTILDEHIKANQLKEALEILENPSFSWLLGDDKKTDLKTILDEHINATQLKEALKILENPSFSWLLGDDKKTYFQKIADKFSSMGEHAKAKKVEEKIKSPFRLKMGLDPFPC